MTQNNRAGKTTWADISILTWIITVMFFLIVDVYFVQHGGGFGYILRRIAPPAMVTGVIAATLAGLRTKRSLRLGLLAFNLATATTISTLTLAQLLRNWNRTGLSRRYSGIYQVGFEMSSFETDDEDGQWWTSCKTSDCGGPPENAPLAPPKTPRSDPQDTLEWRKFHVIVDGELSPLGSHGHMGVYARELVVSRVIQIQALEDTGVPAEPGK